MDTSMCTFYSEGMKLVLDFVFNHCGKRCQLVQEGRQYKPSECVCVCHVSCCIAGCPCRCIFSKEEVFLHGGRVQAARIQGSWHAVGVPFFDFRASFHVRSLPVVLTKQSSFSKSYSTTPSGGTPRPCNEVGAGVGLCAGFGRVCPGKQGLPCPQVRDILQRSCLQRRLCMRCTRVVCASVCVYTPEHGDRVIFSI